jgi:hypothetical protein
MDQESGGSGSDEEEGGVEAVYDGTLKANDVSFIIYCNVAFKICRDSTMVTVQQRRFMRATLTPIGCSAQWRNSLQIQLLHNRK